MITRWIKPTSRSIFFLVFLCMLLGFLPLGARAAETTDTYAVTVTASQTEGLKAGDTVTLTASVTCNGAEVTDLEAAGLYLWWWGDCWNDHTDGNADAGISDNTGRSLMATVTLPSAGTYYIASELKDSTDTTRLTITYTTFTVAAESVVDTTITEITDLSCDFIMGMDFSSIVSELESGVVYQDFDGNRIDNVSDFCKFLKTCGVTHVRVRVWNDPYDANGFGYGGGNSDVAKAVTIAEGCAAAGLGMLVDFHCSDFWCDPGKQQAPKAWAAYTTDEKAAALQTFLTDSLTQIKATGAEISMVQVGNETTSSFIGETDTAAVCALFNAGASAVRNFDPTIQIAIHVTNPEAYQMTVWAGNLDTHNVDYDILATSYYPYWHGTLDNLKNQLSAVKETYGKDVMVAETSYAYTLEDTDGHANTVREGSNDTATAYPFSVDGQAKYLADLIGAVNEAGGLGVFYWEPAWITVGDTSGLTGEAYDSRVAANQLLWEQYGSGWASSYAAAYDPEDAGVWYGGSAVDNQAMFDAEGKPLDSITVWNQVKPEQYTHSYTAEVTASTCTQAGYTIYTCSKCGDSYRAEETAATGHTWDSGTVTTEPTETTAGVRTYTCTVCGETKTEGIPALGEETEPPTVSLSLSQNGGNVRMTGRMTNLAQVTDHGFVYITKARLGSKTLTVNTTGRTKVSINGNDADGSYRYSMTPRSESTTYVFRAYVTYVNDAGKTVYVYSNPIYTSYTALQQE